MRCRLGVGSLLACLGMLACAQIVGVEDVRLRGTGAKPTTPQTGDDEDTDGTDPDPTNPIPDAATDGGGTGCNGAVACVRYVFLTSGTFTGKLGGLAGADAACLTASQSTQASPLLKGRLFRAWLSDSTKNAADRIPQGTMAFRRLDGSTFTTSYRALVSNFVIANALNIDEQGNSRTGAALDLNTWTGTDASGIATANTCNNWTSDASTVNGSTGDSQATDGTWTSFTIGQSCNATRRLYCVEF